MRHALIYLALVGILSMAAPTYACLNDEDSGRYEKSYQQQYEPQQAVPLVNSITQQPYALAGMGVGSALLIGSLAFSLLRRKRQD